MAGHRGRVVWRKAYGARAVEPQREAMTTDTMFDLASLTKIVATATSIMILVERGEVRLNDPAVKFIPEMKGGGRDAITIARIIRTGSSWKRSFGSPMERIRPSLRSCNPPT